MAMARKRKKSGGNGLVVGVVTAVVVGGLGAGVAFAMSKRDDKSDPQPAKRKTIEPRPGVGGNGKVWVDDNDYGKGQGKGGKARGEKPLPPEDFDYAGNGIWISPDCGYVIEGNLFWGDVSMEAETVEAALALRSAPDLERPDNSIRGFLAYLIETMGVKQPEDAVWEVLRQVSPLCADVDPNTDWGEGMYTWFNNFVERVTDFFEEELGAIGFEDEE